MRGLFAGEIGSMLEGPKIGQQAPWLLTSDDYAQLEKDLGKKEAMGTFFWLCRGLYMTRVSDGFQLTLESDNVFSDYATPKPDNEANSSK